MKNTNKFIAIILSILLIVLLIDPSTLNAKGGRSFGGSRSFGSSRSFGGSRSTRSFSSSSRSFGSKSYASPKAPSSFGGVRRSSADIKRSYPPPRQRMQYSTTNQMGVPQNYNVNHYGDFASGLMMGYMAGSIPWYWHTPFHGAFYYTQPVIVENEDGTVDVYPPEFNWTKLIMVILFFGAIIFVIVVVIRNKRRQKLEAMSKSSFS